MKKVVFLVMCLNWGHYQLHVVPKVQQYRMCPSKFGGQCTFLGLLMTGDVLEEGSCDILMHCAVQVYHRQSLVSWSCSYLAFRQSAHDPKQETCSPGNFKCHSSRSHPVPFKILPEELIRWPSAAVNSTG